MISEENGIKAMAELNEFDLRGCKINVKKSVHAGKPLEVKKEVVLEVETFKIFIGNLNCDVSKEYVVNLVEPFGRTVEVETFNTKAFVVWYSHNMFFRLCIVNDELIILLFTVITFIDFF